MLLRSVALWTWLSIALPIFLATIDNWEVPRTWTPGELVTALMMNRHVRDNLSALKSNHFARQTFRGLRLQTHPDANAFDQYVHLDYADEIVMDDGVKVGPWNNLLANMAGVGAGGLDTGVELPATWYEIYAIRKSSDGTKNLLLHRAKNYFLDEQQINTPTSTLLRDAAARTRLAQSFSGIATAGPLEFFDTMHAKVGAPVGNIWFQLEADSAGSPSGTALAITNKLDVAKLPTSSIWIRWTFRSPATLSTGTTYWLVMYGDFAISATDHCTWARDTANSYAGGEPKSFDGATWTATTNDMAFKVNVTLNDTVVTMPAGYDQKALIGYVYNNSGSSFVRFTAVDNLVTIDYLSVISGSAVTVPTLVGIPLPPRRTALWFTFSATVVADQLGVFGVPGFSDTSDQPQRVYGVAAGASLTQGLIGPLVTQFEAVYAMRRAGTGTFNLWVHAFRWF